jgi:ATP-binding cassette subfamily B protein
LHINVSQSSYIANVNLALVSIPLNEAKVAFNRMFEFVNVPTEKEEGKTIEYPITSVNIDNLSFRFPGRKCILNHISMYAPINEITFLVGESGCGKSTLCKLLEKSYEPESGRILLNNSKDLKDISFDSWRKIIGVIPQEVFIFNGTVLDNIYLGASNGETEKDVLAICSHWGSRHVYQTITSRVYDNSRRGRNQFVRR